MDYTTISYNKLRDLAKEKGFEGNNAKRADLIAFLESLDAPTMEDAILAAAAALEGAEPVTTEELVAAAIEASQEANQEAAPAAAPTPAPAPAAATAQPKKSDKIKARRADVANVVREIFAENAIAMNWGGVVQKYEAKMGVKHDRIIWHDIGHAIEDLCKEGTVKSHVPEKGRVTYQRVSAD